MFYSDIVLNYQRLYIFNDVKFMTLEDKTVLEFQVISDQLFQKNWVIPKTASFLRLSE